MKLYPIGSKVTEGRHCTPPKVESNPGPIIDSVRINSIFGAKQIIILLVICIGWVNVLWANDGRFLPRQVKPIEIYVYSDRNGTPQEEDFQFNSQEYCFSETFYCFMDDGRCVCPLHKCKEWPDEETSRAHWMVIGGTDAEKVCGRPALHDLTNTCLCNFDKTPPCDGCNLPAKSPKIHSEDWVPQNYRSWIPPDCRHR